MNPYRRSPPQIRPSRRNDAPILGVLALAVTVWLAWPGCAALQSAAPGLESAAMQGLAAFVAAEAQQAGIPPTSPAYQTAILAARAIEAEQADASAQIQQRLDAIVAEMHARHRASRTARDAGLPPAHAVLPGAEGGR